MSDQAYLQRELGGLVEALDLPAKEKEYLRTRWLGQLVWMDAKANASRRWFRGLRGFTIVGGLIVPAMISQHTLFCDLSTWYWTAIGLSLAVGSAAALESFLHLGDRWRHYRSNIEALKSEGWLFSLSGGHYKRYASQADAFPSFTERVEAILRDDVGEYVRTVIAESEKGRPPAEL